MTAYTQLNNEKTINLLLIGATGKGKSSLGNTLLKRRELKTSSRKTSETLGINFDYGMHDDQVLMVVDCMGVGDTRLDSTEQVNSVKKSMEKAIGLSTEGYDAILLVENFGGRFTGNDLAAVELLKKMFHPSFVEKYFIMAMTYGDNFEREQEEDGITFEDWCESQDGEFKKLLAECGGRIVLFDNVTKDAAKRDSQIDELLEMVARLPNGGKRYTDKHFHKAKKARDEALVQSKELLVREYAFKEASLIRQTLENLEMEGRIQTRINGLQKLSSRCEKLVLYIEKEDKGTKALDHLRSTALDLLHLIKAKVKSLKEGSKGPSIKELEDKVKALKEEADRKKNITTSLAIGLGCIVVIGCVGLVVATGGLGAGAVAAGSSLGGADTGGALAATGGADTGGALAATGGAVTGGALAATGGAVTGGALAATGGAVTGGALAATGGAVTGGALAATGGAVTGGTLAATGTIGSSGATFALACEFASATALGGAAVAGGGAAVAGGAVLAKKLSENN